MEESLVAIQALWQWLAESAPPAGAGRPPAPGGASSTGRGTGQAADGGGGGVVGVTVVDLCCGKGVFAMLLSYLAARPALAAGLGSAAVAQLVMVEKATAGQISWVHIEEANRDVGAGPLGS